jgi:hypothetical protein
MAAQCAHRILIRADPTAKTKNATFSQSVDEIATASYRQAMIRARPTHLIDVNG